jgi:putative membrane protein
MRRADDSNPLPVPEAVQGNHGAVAGDNGSGEMAGVESDPIAHVPSLAGDLINVVRGFAMGAANAVPGVSGGTVALILGFYQRLVTAISHIDSTLFSLASRGKFRAAAAHVDLRFVAALGFGVAAGIVSLAGLMQWLLEYRMAETFAVFLGLILASVWLVNGWIDSWNLPRTAACLTGFACAVVISNLPPGSGSGSLWYLFVSGAVAICSMILPGISGAFVLLLFGIYHEITGLIKQAAKFDISVEAVTQIAVFAAGCLFGLLAFSRLLRWLLEHYRSATMAALLGLMIGSAAKLWPLQTATEETANLPFKLRVMQYVAPADWPGSLVSLIGLGIGSAIAVLAIEWLATRHPSAEQAAGKDRSADRH